MFLMIKSYSDFVVKVIYTVIDLNSRQIEFAEIVRDLIHSDKVQRMENIKHHVGGVSCLEHSIFVAYLSFLMCKKLGLDFRAAARGGLLHDLYLCDWQKEHVGRVRRLFIHPKLALKNASENFDISNVEMDIIENHMWPLTINKMPHHRVSAVVSLADKVCAVLEMSGVYSRMKTRRRLYNFNNRYAFVI